MDDLNSKEGIGLQASFCLAELGQFHLVSTTVCSSDIHGLCMTSSPIARSVLVDLPQRALKSFSCTPTSCWGNPNP